MTVLGSDDKVRLLRSIIRGADDVFAMKTERAWKPIYAPIEDKNLVMHLSGLAEFGSYVSVPNGNDLPVCWWVAADFDGKKCQSCYHSSARGARFCEKCQSRLGDWEQDVPRAVGFLIEAGANVFVNLSRSAQGAHVRVLFREPVPGWMARRWMLAWLEEAGVVDENADTGVPTSFDRVFPPYDNLQAGLNPETGKRYPGSLMGAPLNGKLARLHGGTLPLDPESVARGDFTPDGLHWEHALRAQENRAWGTGELRAALADAPGTPDLEPPSGAVSDARHLPVIHTEGALQFALDFCAFFRKMREPGYQSYDLWVALAANLHRFGEDGRHAFHEVSQSDPRYSFHDTDQKWKQTAAMHPVRCDTLVAMGYRCPHLDTVRCAGAAAPAYFYEHAEYEPR